MSEAIDGRIKLILERAAFDIEHRVHVSLHSDVDIMKNCMLEQRYGIDRIFNIYGIPEPNGVLLEIRLEPWGDFPNPRTDWFKRCRIAETEVERLEAERDTYKAISDVQSAQIARLLQTGDTL